jgi:4-hydroxy-tetrahydrodipicolinate synthase
MSNGKKYQGVVVPMVTPFEESGEIDEPAAERIAEYLVEGGTAPFVLGTTGELASIPSEQRDVLVKTVARQVNGRAKVYAGISGCVLSESYEEAQKYYDFGADVFVAHVPYYYPLTTDLMRKYFETLAENIPGPLVLYNIPITTNISLPLDIIDALSQHPNIIGLKDSERSEERLKNSVQMWANRQDFALFCGWGAQMSNALAAGFDGIVPSTANIVPTKYKSLYDAVMNKDMNTALQLQKETDTISKIYQNNRILSQSLPALKVIMNYLKLCKTEVLPPLQVLDDSEAQGIINDFSKQMKIG